jgi:DNA primase
MNRIQRVSTKHRCEVCGHADWCSFTDELILCSRLINYSTFIKTNYGDGGAVHLHRREGVTAVRRSEFVDENKSDNVTLVPLADITVRDGVYSALIRQSLTLKPEHRKALHERGLDDDEIDRLGYVSTPSKDEAPAIAHDLSTRFDVSGVPGFFRDGDEWKLVGMWPGYLIPYRNHRGQIQALNYRRHDWKRGDEVGKYIWLSSNPEKYPFGVKSGTPLHWSKPHLLPGAQEIVVTEGALKSDICSFFLNAPFVAASGVTQFGSDFGVNIKQKFPHVERVVISLDSDWRTNDAVRLGLSTLRRNIEDAGLEWRVRSWPSEFKGLDDYLFASRMDERQEAA